MAKGDDCAHCGAKIEGKGLYCGPACKQAAYRQRHAQPGAWRTAPARAVETKQAQTSVFACAYCGGEVHRTGLQAKMLYCSDKCKMKAYRKRKADKARPLDDKQLLTDRPATGRLINANDIHKHVDVADIHAWSDKMQKRLKPR